MKAVAAFYRVEDIQMFAYCFQFITELPSHKREVIRNEGIGFHENRRPYGISPVMLLLQGQLYVFFIS